MRRMILAVAALGALAVPTSVAAVGLASPAMAASGTTCAKLSGVVTGTITFKKCSFATGKDKTNKTLSGQGIGLASGGTLTWSPSGQTTTVGAPSFTSPGQGSCKPKNTEYIVNGTVTGGTSTHTQAGDPFDATVCVKNSNNKISLLKGTVATL